MSQIVVATAKGVRISPRKVAEVAALIRKRSVADALVILEHTPRRAAKPLHKVVSSAKANAVYNHRLAEGSLQITGIEVNGGSTMRRFKPVAHGGAHRILKRSSHVRVTLTGEEKPKKKTAAPKAGGKKEEEE
ncbi:MAG TPA: 50S ribosomal protein L22 [Candidatus Saccharimonadales bacterium]|nr:50S ribosomal protein L22 [Candidatus Saccharimonadales bacterium]